MQRRLRSRSGKLEKLWQVCRTRILMTLHWCLGCPRRITTWSPLRRSRPTFSCGLSTGGWVGLFQVSLGLGLPWIWTGSSSKLLFEASCVFISCVVHAGMGMFSEAYILFSIGNIKPLLAISYPNCYGKQTPHDCNQSAVGQTSNVEICGIIGGVLQVYHFEFIVLMCV